MPRSLPELHHHLRTKFKPEPRRDFFVELIETLIELEKRNMDDLTKLTAAIAAEKTAADSAIAVIIRMSNEKTALEKQLADALAAVPPSNQPAIDAAATDAQSVADALNVAVAAVSPSPEPVPAPAPAQ